MQTEQLYSVFHYEKEKVFWTRIKRKKKKQTKNIVS